MSELTTSERLAWLRLARSESVGPASFVHLVARYGAASAALQALPDLARRGGRSEAPRVPSEAEAARELAAGEALGGRLVAACERGFPRLLARLDPPPPLIWVLGDDEVMRRPLVAIVGARSASAGGLRLARTLAGDLGAAGYGIVSGMARGIDAAAHQASLDTGAVAVMAGGVDQIYPPENAALYEAIASRGAIVSERVVGHVAKAADFPRRNRLISGLALGVVVVEAELRSGSLITARLAGEQGREVFAVPGSPLDPRARGANSLLRQGAALVEEAQDVIDVLSGLRLAEPEPPAYRPPAAGDDAPDDELRAAILDALSPTPTAIDEIARAVGAATPAVLAGLMELTLAGRAELVAGGMAVLA